MQFNGRTAGFEPADVSSILAVSAKKVNNYFNIRYIQQHLNLWVRFLLCKPKIFAYIPMGGKKGIQKLKIVLKINNCIV